MCIRDRGRTDTFIVIDHVLEQIEKEKVVDIPGAITKIRQKKDEDGSDSCMDPYVYCVYTFTQYRSNSHSSMMLS